MVAEQASLLPLHAFLAQLQAWSSDRSDAQREALRASLERVAAAYRATGAFLATETAPIGPIALGIGSLRDVEGLPQVEGPARHVLSVGAEPEVAATLWVDGSAAADGQLAEAVRLALAAVWAQHEALVQRQLLDALDMAIRGIATIASVDRILQLIVDGVRELVGAKYAALGIVGSHGRIEQFIVSGITAEQRALLGAPPEGHGLLGLIIRDDRSLMIDDITTDPRRYGFPPHHPEMRSLLGVPVRAKGRTIGNLYLTEKTGGRAFSEDDLGLVEKFALHAGIAIENARLHEEIGRLAIVEERQRISQDLHDSIIQSLYAISLSLEDLPEIINEDPQEGAARADRAIDSIHGTIRDIRNFIMGLQPELLDEADLGSGVQSLAAEFQGNTLIDLEVLLHPNLPQLPREHGAHILAITREALSNVARHSGATRASLDLAALDGTIRLVIGDNGSGFDVGQARSNRQRGLANLRSRAEAIGGTLTLNSEPGAGTRLELVIPLDDEAGTPEGSTEERDDR